MLNGQTWVQNDKKSHFIWCNTYLRNEGSIDSHLLYICVKINFFKVQAISLSGNHGGGEKGPKKCSSAMFYLTRY